MSSELSSQSEQFLASTVAEGNHRGRCRWMPGNDGRGLGRTAAVCSPCARTRQPI